MPLPAFAKLVFEILESAPDLLWSGTTTSNRQSRGIPREDLLDWKRRHLEDSKEDNHRLLGRGAPELLFGESPLIPPARPRVALRPLMQLGGAPHQATLPLVTAVLSM
jgi:hypothetical protein